MSGALPDGSHRGFVYVIYRQITGYAGVGALALAVTSSVLFLVGQPAYGFAFGLVAQPFGALSLYHLGALRTLGKVNRGEL
jgi:hypothetical protein